MNLKEMKEKRNSNVEEMSNIVDKAMREERALTDEEKVAYDNLKKSIEEFDETIKRVEELEKSKMTESSDNEKEKDTQAEEKEDRATKDIEIFANYIRNIVEERADSNLTKSDNGVIIPTTIADKIIDKVYDISPIIEKSTKYKTKGKLEIPTVGLDDENINMAYAEEFKDLESKSKQFSSVTLDDYLAGALTKISNSLINNTDIDLANKVVELMATDVARFLEKEGIHGTEAKAKGCSTIKLIVNPQSSNAITVDDLIDLKNKVKQAYRKNAIFVMNNETKTEIEKLKDNNGRYLFNDAIEGPFDGKILGYPVYISENMDDIGEGNVPILFGDFSGLGFKQPKNIEMQILRELFATQHATGIVLWTNFDIEIENYQKLAKIQMKASE